MAVTKEQLARLHFDAEVLDVVIGGQSAIDNEEGLNVRSPDDAFNFLNCYGFNIENPIEKAELFGHFQEAVNFIRANFQAEIPRKVAELSDPSQLLIMSTQRPLPGTHPTQQLSLWACALLKVMHTISHIDKDVRTSYFPDIQKQIMDRFYKFVHNEEGRLFIGKDSRDPDLIELVSFESKPKKSRDSLILKMLHKPENVAEDIFDRVGLRFVTRTRYDALRLIRFMRDRSIIMPANIKPSRSRNTLVDTAAFRETLAAVKSALHEGKLGFEEAEARLRDAAQSRGKGSKGDNPHSSQDYASIQFTCRQLIKITNPLYEDIKALKAYKDKAIPEELVAVINRMDLKNTQKEVRFFYPFEVQVYDELSHKESVEGQSAHSAYKRSQVQASQKRVMRGLV